MAALQVGIGNSQRFAELVEDLSSAINLELRRVRAQEPANHPNRELLARSAFISRNVPKGFLVGVICGLLAEPAVPAAIKENAADTLLQGIVSGELEANNFVKAFSVSNNSVRAVLLKDLCCFAKERNSAETILANAFSKAAASAPVSGDDSLAVYLKVGCPELCSWSSVVLALHRRRPDGTSILEESLNSSDQVGTAGFVRYALGRIKAAEGERSPALILLASAFLKCRGLSLGLGNREVASVVKSCCWTLIETMTGAEPVRLNFLNTVLTAEIDVARALIKHFTSGSPIQAAAVLSQCLDRRLVMGLLGRPEDHGPSRLLVWEVGSFFGNNREIDPSYGYAFLSNNSGLIEDATRSAVLTNFRGALLRTSDPSQLPVVEQIMKSGPAAMLPSIVPCLGRLANTEEHLSWLVQRADKFPSDIGAVIDAISATAFRFKASGDPKKVSAAQAALKRLRTLRRSKASYRRIRNLGLVRRLNRAIADDARFSPALAVMDAIVRNVRPWRS